MHSPIAATALLEPIPRRHIHPKAAARFPAAFRALFRFPTPTVRKPQEVVILVTITACLMGEADDRQRPRPHTRPHALSSLKARISTALLPSPVSTHR